MPFLPSLMYEKIELAIISRQKTRDASSKETSEWNSLPIADDRLLDFIPAESMEDLSHSENTFYISIDNHQLKHVCIFIQVNSR